MEDQLKTQIAQLIRQEVKDLIAQARPSLTYNGQPKPVNPNYPAPIPTGRVNTGDLYNQVDVYFETDLEDGEANIVVDFGTSDYWEWVFYGRRPSLRYPPLQAIEAWVESKPALQYPNLSVKSRAFLAARSIKEYGYYGIIQDQGWEGFFNEIAPRLLPVIEEYGINYVEKLINERLVLRSEQNRP